MSILIFCTLTVNDIVHQLNELNKMQYLNDDEIMIYNIDGFKHLLNDKQFNINKD